MMEEPISKNEKAEELFGTRRKGTSIFCPSELGYACPICGASNDLDLSWSEYRYYLYCHTYNLDIPSCLCVKYYEPKISGREMSPKEKIQKAIMIFEKSHEGVEKKCVL